jgi:hypothetical protein
MIRFITHALILTSLWTVLAHSSLDSMAADGPSTTWMPRLEGFQLTDQHGSEHRLTFPRDKLLLLAVADRRGAEEIDGWVTPLRQLHSPGFDILGIAQLDPVPKPFRGRVVRQLERRYSYPLLLDWEGQVARSLFCVKNQANVFLLDRHGQVIHRQEGPVSQGQLDQLRAAIDRELAREASDMGKLPGPVETGLRSDLPSGTTRPGG